MSVAEPRRRAPPAAAARMVPALRPVISQTASYPRSARRRPKCSRSSASSMTVPGGIGIEFCVSTNSRRTRRRLGTQAERAQNLLHLTSCYRFSEIQHQARPSPTIAQRSLPSATFDGQARRRDNGGTAGFTCRPRANVLRRRDE